MALHGMHGITLGVTDVAATTPFYEDFGLEADGSGTTFSSTHGGAQLSIVERKWRQIVDTTLGCDDDDDLDRIRHAATAAGHDYVDLGDAIEIVEPVTGLLIRVKVMPRVELDPVEQAPMNQAGYSPRLNARPDTLFVEATPRPRKLGHIAMSSPDIEATGKFLGDIIGAKLSDRVPGNLAFWRTSTDHHNFALAQAPGAVIHHLAWQMDDMDAIGHAARNLLTDNLERHAWGLGRHFLGSNLFWYFKDPAGNFVEYFSDIDQIVNDAEWMARDWEPDKALYIWGPPTPDALRPTDIGEIIETMMAN